MSDIDPVPTPAQIAEEVAGLEALVSGLQARIKARKTALLHAVKGQRAASWDTPFGRINVARQAGGKIIVSDPAALLAEVEAHFPDEVVLTKSVRSSWLEAFLSECKAVAGMVIHEGTGAVVEWATVTEPGAPYVAYPASSEQRDAKAYAALLVDEQATRLTGGLKELTS